MAPICPAQLRHFLRTVPAPRAGGTGWEGETQLIYSKPIKTYLCRADSASSELKGQGFGCFHTGRRFPGSFPLGTHFGDGRQCYLSSIFKPIVQLVLGSLSSWGLHQAPGTHQGTELLPCLKAEETPLAACWCRSTVSRHALTTYTNNILLSAESSTYQQPYRSPAGNPGSQGPRKSAGSTSSEHSYYTYTRWFAVAGD